MELRGRIRGSFDGRGYGNKVKDYRNTELIIAITINSDKVNGMKIIGDTASFKDCKVER